jgi:hypothetical protein
MAGRAGSEMHGNQGAAPKMTDASMAPKPNEFDIA